jgi:WD40 repeat protein
MPAIEELALGAFVVEAGFLGEAPAFALGDGTVRIVGGEAAGTVKAHRGAILAAAVTGDGRMLTGGDDGVVALTDSAGAVAPVAERPKKWIDHVAVGPNGAVAFSAGKHAVVRFPDGRERTLEHKRSVGGIAFAPKGLRLAAARYNGVTLWWAGTETAPVELGWNGAHTGVTFSPDGKYVVSTMQENALHGWKLEDGKDMRMTGYPSKPRSVSWSVKGRFLATSGANAAILWPFHFRDGPMGRQPMQLGAREVVVSRVACHPKEETVAIGYQDGMILAVRFGDAQEALLRRPGKNPVSALAWDRQGRRLAFGCEDGSAGIVDIAADVPASTRAAGSN